MTTFVFIDNYRGFSNELIPISRVNFLVGENSTGKSSFLELMELFSYTPFWLFDPQFETQRIDSRHFLDLVSAAATSKRAFTIGVIQVNEKPGKDDHGMLVTYVNHEGRPHASRVSVIDAQAINSVDGRLWVSTEGTKYKSRQKACEPNSGDETPIERARRYVSIHGASAGFKEEATDESLRGAPLFVRFRKVFYVKSEDGKRNLKIPYPFGTPDINLAPIRTKTRRTYDAPQTEFSPEGHHTPYVIRKQLASLSEGDKFKTFLEKLGKDSGLFQSVKVKAFGKGPVSPFELQIVLGKIAHAIENVGYGVSQALPVLVEMFVRPKKTLFTIQQPEVHLHPKAQATLGDLTAELSRSEEKRFVIETHSDFLIDRFRLNVRNHGAIPSQLLFFERTQNINRVVALVIDQDGNLPEEQPDGYREFFLNESLAILG